MVCAVGCIREFNKVFQQFREWLFNCIANAVMDAKRFFQQTTSKKGFLFLIFLGMISSIFWATSTKHIPSFTSKINVERLYQPIDNILIHLYLFSNQTEEKINKQPPTRKESGRSSGNTINSKHILIKKKKRSWFPFPLKKYEINKSCPVNFIVESSGKNLTYFDAIIFNAVNYPDARPPTKTPGQVWVYFTMESPFHTHDSKLNKAEWRNQINWTMTYRSDSDVFYPYGRIIKRTKREHNNFLAITKKKTKLVAWFVSNCNTPSQRHKYVQEMRKTISVDIYGLCGDHKCPRSMENNCSAILSRDYKFYLSFENSLCVDYITEKLYHYIKADIVPVVRGGANYTKFLPPKSYINTADFKSPKHLTDYLHYLDKNLTAYVEYLQWKNEYYSERYTGDVCELFKKLSSPKMYTNVYNDVHSWWHNNTCFSPKDIG